MTFVAEFDEIATRSTKSHENENWITYKSLTFLCIFVFFVAIFYKLCCLCSLLFKSLGFSRDRAELKVLYLFGTLFMIFIAEDNPLASFVR